MNTFQLSCFLAVANSLSFARAAEQMRVSQPAITHQIQSLENELNVKLFRRSTRLVEITPEGQAFLYDAKSMLSIAEQAKLRFSDPQERLIEPLSIGCSSYTQLELLTDILHELLAEHPNLHPRLHVVPHDQLFHLLETETVDVILDIREGGETGTKLTFKELRQSSLACVCRQDALPPEKKSISTMELANEKLIFCDPITLDPEIAKLQWKLTEGVSPADIHFCSTAEGAVVLADAGYGLAILPELMVPANHHIRVIRIEDAPKLSFGLFYKSHPGDGVIKHFIQHAKQHFSDME
ncbi:MAG: LysR family transcriptional regulator [Clostridiales bacterium]|nr:LysR family transcriptional regulator [Clostridiales bacterium]